MPADVEQCDLPTCARRPQNLATHSSNLKRKYAEITVLYEAAMSEAQQLMYRKDNYHPPTEVELVAEEKAYLSESHRRRLSDIVSKHCLTVIKTTIAHKWAWPFKQPVDTNTYKDYLNVVKSPMDLGTIKTRCETGFYKDPESFLADAVRVFDNARKYNPPGSDVFVMAGGVQEKFHERWAAGVVPKLKDEHEASQKEEAALKRQRIEATAIHEAEMMESQCSRLLSFLDELQASITEGRSMAACLCKLMPAPQQDQLCLALQKQGPQQMESVVSMVLSQQPSLAAATNDQREVELSVAACDALLLRQLQHLLACGTEPGRAAAQEEAGGGGAGAAAEDEERQQLCWPGLLQGAGLKMRQRCSSKASVGEVNVPRPGVAGRVATCNAGTRPPPVRLLMGASTPDSPLGSRASADPLALDNIMADISVPSPTNKGIPEATASPTLRPSPGSSAPMELGEEHAHPTPAVSTDVTPKDSAALHPQQQAPAHDQHNSEDFGAVFGSDDLGNSYADAGQQTAASAGPLPDNAALPVACEEQK